MGVVVRDYEGNVRGALGCALMATLDPVSAKAYVAWRMADFISQLGLCVILVEGDSMEIINALRSGDVYRGTYVALVEDAKMLLNSSCRWELQHVRRTGNEAAHFLAKYALQHCAE
jgi:hypothetical protein